MSFNLLRVKLVVLSAFILLSCGQSAQQSTQDDTSLDLNSDGKVDVHYEYGNSSYIELVDRNFDTVADESHKFGLDNKIIKSKFDDDFDGKAETTSFYKDGTNYLSLVDEDVDGEPDLFFVYKSGVLKYAEKYYERTDTGSQSKVGRVEFKFGYPISEEKFKKTSLTKEEFVESYMSKVSKL